MNLSRLITSLVCIAFLGGTISAGDLTKIDRKIG
jgi:hypothetical protein